MGLYFLTVVGIFSTFVEISAETCGPLSFHRNEVAEGDTAYLTLKATSAIETLKWNKAQNNTHREVIYNYNRDKTTESSKYFDYKYDSKNEYVLVIRDVGKKDAGRYIVLCNNKDWSEYALINVTVAPNIIEVGRESFRENQTRSINCITKEGRPPLGHTIIIKNTSYNSSKTKIEITNKTFTVESSLEKHLTRYDNNASIRCCVDVLGTEKCGNWSEINVTFPAVYINLTEVSKDGQVNGETVLTLTCAVGAANPTNRIEWTGVKDITWAPTEPIYHGDKDTSGLSTSVMMRFNLTKEHNGRNIVCIAVNDEFTNHTLFAIYTVNITYEPLITIHGPENRTVYTGDYVHLICKVDSNPVSNISWLHKDHTLLNATTGKRLDLFFPNISKDDALTYSCVANYNKGLHKKDVTLIVEERSLKPAADYGTYTPEKSVIGPVIGGAVGFVVVVIALCVICQRRKKHGPKKQMKDKPEDNTTQHASLGERERDSQHCNNAEVNNQIDASQKNKEEIPEYASVAPKATRIVQKNESAQPQQEKSKSTANELVYAELDLQTQSPVKPVEKQQEATEYVSIDFAKTGTIKEEDNVEYGNM